MIIMFAIAQQDYNAFHAAKNGMAAMTKAANKQQVVRLQHKKNRKETGSSKVASSSIAGYLPDKGRIKAG